MTFVPDFDEKMKEEIARSREEISHRNQGESYSLSSARVAHEAAQERLARVNEPGRGFRNYSHEERQEAVRDAAEKETAYRKVSNEYNREKYLEGVEAKKQEKAAIGAALIKQQEEKAELDKQATKKYKFDRSWL